MQKCLFCYNQVHFGIASAPVIFQQFINQILKGLTGTLLFGWYNGDWVSLVLRSQSMQMQKVQAKVEAEVPSNVSQLRLFQGLNIMHVAQF